MKQQWRLVCREGLSLSLLGPSTFLRKFRRLGSIEYVTRVKFKSIFCFVLNCPDMLFEAESSLEKSWKILMTKTWKRWRL